MEAPLLPYPKIGANRPIFTILPKTIRLPSKNLPNTLNLKQIQSTFAPIHPLKKHICNNVHKGDNQGADLLSIPNDEKQRNRENDRNFGEKSVSFCVKTKEQRVIFSRLLFVSKEILLNFLCFFVGLS